MTTMTLAYRNTPLHASVAAAVARVLEAYDIEADYVTGPDASLSQMLADGAIDLFATVWHPDEDSLFLSPAAEAFGSMYRPAFGLFVSGRDGTPLSAVTSVAGLAASDVSRSLITPESVVPQVRRMVAAYGLTEAGFTIESQPDENAFAALLAAFDAGEPVVAPLWAPCFLIHKAGLRMLDDPQQAGGPELNARLVISRSAKAEADTDMIDELDELTLGNKVVSALDEAVRYQDMTPDEAAEAWQRGKLIMR